MINSVIVPHAQEAHLLRQRPHDGRYTRSDAVVSLRQPYPTPTPSYPQPSGELTEIACNTLEQVPIKLKLFAKGGGS